MYASENCAIIKEDKRTLNKWGRAVINLLYGQLSEGQQ